jgi:class 3 adenylate cyclase
MALHQSKICMGCWEHLHLPVPLRGVASVPFRAFGIRPSRMNPNTCTICETMFERIMKKRHVIVDATVLFADLRGYTSLSQSHSAEAVSMLLDTFYDESAGAIWEHDGILNKTMGDGLMAVFNFPISHDDHAIRALRAARQIQARWREIRLTLPETAGEDIGVGIGVDTGQVNFGEFGHSHTDITAIGTVVNTAARAQAAAASGQILLTEAVHARVQGDLPEGQARDYQLKGFQAATRLYAA